MLFFCNISDTLNGYTYNWKFAFVNYKIQNREK